MQANQARKESSSFIESLKYSRDKCMLFHALNTLSITLFAMFFVYVVDTFAGHDIFILFTFLIPFSILLLSFYLVARHDLTFIEMKRRKGTAIWRDNIEYKISKFAKAIFFQK